MPHDDHLIAAFDALMASAPSLDGVADAISAARTAMQGTVTTPEPRDLPPALAESVQRHAAASGPAGGLVEAVDRLRDELVWSVAYDDHDEPDMQIVRANYRYTPLVGPEPFARHHSDEVAVFMTVQGPGVTYPPHVHKAPELYVVVGGSGDWQIGDGDFASKAPGDWIWHPTGTRHAMRTHSEAMSALAVWTTDPRSPSVIVRG
ncbi:MAG: dimethylsulfonioproprionate lyase family protein [Actinomycetota bacterium]